MLVCWQERKDRSLLNGSKEVGLEVVLMPRHQGAGENHVIKRAYTSFENVEKLKYVGTAVTNKNLILEEMKNKQKSEIACYRSVQNPQSPRMFSLSCGNECGGSLLH
jgi:hypothetical protein